MGVREIGYMFGQYKRLKNKFTGVLTGKGCHMAATKPGHGIRTAIYREMLCTAKLQRQDRRHLRAIAIYAAQKAAELGAKVVAMSDSSGYVFDKGGIKLDIVKQIKEVERGRILEYAKRAPGSVYTEGCRGIWTIPCDIALPCATQNELDLESAEALVANGVKAVCEGANMPSTPEAVECLQKNGVLLGPAKAANAGGVATSGLEMTQNSMRLSWSFEEVDAKLRTIMQNIYHSARKAAAEVGAPGNMVAGANVAGFLKVAEAMKWQGA